MKINNINIDIMKRYCCFVKIYAFKFNTSYYIYSFVIKFQIMKHNKSYHEIFRFDLLFYYDIY